MKAIQEPVYAFSFIYDMLRLLGNEESDAFESAVISRIPDLFKLSRLCYEAISVKLLYSGFMYKRVILFFADDQFSLYFAGKRLTF